MHAHSARECKKEPTVPIQIYIYIHLSVKRMCGFFTRACVNERAEWCQFRVVMMHREKYDSQRMPK